MEIEPGHRQQRIFQLDFALKILTSLSTCIIQDVQFTCIFFIKGILSSSYVAIVKSSCAVPQVASNHQSNVSWKLFFLTKTVLKLILIESYRNQQLYSNQGDCFRRLQHLISLRILTSTQQWQQEQYGRRDPFKIIVSIFRFVVPDFWKPHHALVSRLPFSKSTIYTRISSSWIAAPRMQVFRYGIDITRQPAWWIFQLR